MFSVFYRYGLYVFMYRSFIFPIACYILLLIMFSYSNIVCVSAAAFVTPHKKITYLLT